MTYPYILPPLPYAPAALEPNLGRSSVRLHHDAFFAAYVDRLNGALVPWTQYQDWPLERLLLHWCQLPRTLGQAVRRYGGGVYNHGLYFSSLAPARTTKPSGELLAEVEHSFGSVGGVAPQPEERCHERVRQRMGVAGVLLRGAAGHLHRQPGHAAAPVAPVQRGPVGARVYPGL